MAATSLRLAARSQRTGFPFAYGFYYPEPDADGGEHRWARRRAAIVVHATSPRMDVLVGVNHRDIAADPVDVKVWIDGALALETRLADTNWRTVPVQVGATRRVIVETWVSRVVRPIDLGVADARELGLLVKWRSLDAAAAESR
jgi:hypothetical protein